MEKEQNEQENARPAEAELCGGVPLPNGPAPPGMNPNGYWSCVDGKPTWIEYI
jgi:hypothetical protein